MNTSFGRFNAQFMACYQKQAYQEALDLINDTLDQLPFHAGMIMAWKAGMQSLIGDQAGAIATLQAAMQLGHWYHEEALRQDPDFAALQEQPSFQAVTEECQRRTEHAEATTQPQLTFLEPPPTTPHPWPLLITLHGNMSSANEYAPHWTYAAAQGWLVAVPQSSQLTWAGGYYVWDDYDRALTEIRQHYEAICHRYEIDSARVVLAGYSMGGEVAQKAALRGDMTVHGFIGVEGWVFDLEQLPPLLEAKRNPGLRSYLISGLHAEFLEPSRQIDELLRANGYASQREEMDNEYHGYGSTFEEILGRALGWVV